MLDMHRLNELAQSEMWYDKHYTECDLLQGWDRILDVAKDKVRGREGGRGVGEMRYDKHYKDPPLPPCFARSLPPVSLRSHILLFPPFSSFQS